VETAVAVYGAVLATAIAVGQFVAWLRRRIKVGVSSDFVFEGLDAIVGVDDPSKRDDTRGTPVIVQRGDDELWEQALVLLIVRNEGGAPVQIVAVVVERLTRDGKLQSVQVIPPPLPHVLAPHTRIEVTMQKEILDMTDSVTFFGVVDALGRRYAPPTEQVRQTIARSWDLPTRVGNYVRRDDPTSPPVLSYQAWDRATIDSARRVSNPPTPLIRRPPLLPGPSQRSTEAPQPPRGVDQPPTTE
jgi:hypothetical protein